MTSSCVPLIIDDTESPKLEVRRFIGKLVLSIEIPNENSVRFFLIPVRLIFQRIGPMASSCVPLITDDTESPKLEI